MGVRCSGGASANMGSGRAPGGNEPTCGLLIDREALHQLSLEFLRSEVVFTQRAALGLTRRELGAAHRSKVRNDAIDDLLRHVAMGRELAARYRERARRRRA